MVFRGANLVELITSPPSTADEKIDAIILFLLNSLTITETATDIAGDATKAKLNINPSVALMEKLRPFADKIVNFQKSIDEANMMFAFFDVFLDKIDIMSSLVDISLADY